MVVWELWRSGRAMRCEVRAHPDGHEVYLCDDAGLTAAIVAHRRCQLAPSLVKRSQTPELLHQLRLFGLNKVHVKEALLGSAGITGNPPTEIASGRRQGTDENIPGRFLRGACPQLLLQ